jgi:FMN phosphatase YigB (HAD superfamily)
MLHPRACLVFVDDREPNVDAARAAGLTAWHHHAQDTIDFLTPLAWPDTPEAS